MQISRNSDVRLALTVHTVDMSSWDTPVQPAPLLPDAQVPTAGRINSLDLIRGIAALGILVMNSISFGLNEAAYGNLEQGGNSTPLDTAIGVLARIFVDQKMMALFSLLFGVGIVIFVERSEAKGRRSVWLSLWRNLLLLGIGIVHTIFWDGDILTIYALCAPVVLLLRKLPAWTLFALGVAIANVGALLSLVVESSIDTAGLGSAWLADGGDSSDAADALLLLDAFIRALGLMLIGVALYRSNIVQGDRSTQWFRRAAAWGFAVGVPLSTAGLLIHVGADWSADSAISGHAISTFGTVPLALGYLSLIVLWSQRRATAAQERLQAIGRMALTNYLSQTALGLIVLTWLLGDVDLSRTAILAVVFAIWAFQLAISPWWLERFRFGPVEWLWRSGTYRSWQPLRR